MCSDKARSIEKRRSCLRPAFGDDYLEHPIYDAEDVTTVSSTPIRGLRCTESCESVNKFIRFTVDDRGEERRAVAIADLDGVSRFRIA